MRTTCTVVLANPGEAAAKLEDLVDAILEREVERNFLSSLQCFSEAVLLTCRLEEDQAVRAASWALHYKQESDEAREALERRREERLNGKQLKERRKALGWSQQTLAEAVRCSKARISQIENGDAPSASLARLLELTLAAGEKEKESEND